MSLKYQKYNYIKKTIEISFEILNIEIASKYFIN